MEGLDITYGASDFYKADIMPLPCSNNRIFNFIGDVGDNLNGTPQKISPTLLTDDSFVNLASSKVVLPTHSGSNEPLVMPEVKIRLCAIVGDEDLSKLERAHCPWIKNDVGSSFTKVTFNLDFPAGRPMTRRIILYRAMKQHRLDERKFWDVPSDMASMIEIDLYGRWVLQISHCCLGQRHPTVS